ncbi:MAG: flagellar basal body P-ring protein FlgI, partial [Phycisphaeraceae bacterium]|nr:flagellar basal body P-ring protein FlgI [Phycisphaeraceae bacterium]
MKPATAILILALASGLGCAPAEIQPEAEVTPPPLYNNVPTFLRTTIKSMTQLQGYRSIVVSGHGVVVGLKGTGSAEVPPGLREKMLNEIRRGGIGVKGIGQGSQTAEQFLASLNTAVVEVQAVIPPGAPKGTQLDLVVRALEATQTTSLEGGLLYTTPLSVGGSNLTTPDTTQRAKG